MNATNELRPQARLMARHIPRARVQKAPWRWRLANALRWGFIKGWIAYHAVVPIARFFGVGTFIATLEILVRKANGVVVDYGVVSYRVITNAGVDYIVDDWDGGSNVIDLFNYHGMGTGTAAESVNDTALGAELTTQLNPDNTRATGTKSQPTSNQARTIGTLTVDAAVAVTEHGIFTQAATGGGTLFDRSVFAAVNLASGDSIQFTHTTTWSAGG